MISTTTAHNGKSHAYDRVRVLIIDDEPDLLTALSGILRRAGYAVRTAQNGDRGLDALKQEAADVVITDVIMPRESGLDVIIKVRGLYPATRVIAISGGGIFGPVYLQPNSVTVSAYLLRCERAGADAVLAKPFEASEILAVIERVLA